MGRKAKIDKQMILEAAYELLDEGGIEAVAIKSIAAKLGCSTQPVSWHFGSMAELKKALYYYVCQKEYSPLAEKMAGKDAVEAFFISGVHYLSYACDHPNVFRFTNVDDPIVDLGEGRSLFTGLFDETAVKMLAEQYKIPEDKVAVAVRDTVIYTHGLSLMMIYDNYRMPKEEAWRMMYNVGMKMLTDAGIKNAAQFSFDNLKGLV